MPADKGMYFFYFKVYSVNFFVLGDTSAKFHKALTKTVHLNKGMTNI